MTWISRAEKDNRNGRDHNSGLIDLQHIDAGLETPEVGSPKVTYEHVLESRDIYMPALQAASRCY